MRLERAAIERMARRALAFTMAVSALVCPCAAAAETLFADVPAWTSPVEDTRQVALGDVDGDGDLDLVRASINQATTLYLNLGGTFAATAAWRGPTETTRSVALGDIDGDGDLDLVRGNSGQGATLYRNIGGTFEATPAWQGQPEQTRAIALGDVDGDGDLDLVRGNLDQGSTLYLNVGGTFEAVPSWTGPAMATNAVSLGDVDGDGHLDLVLGNFSQPSALFLNAGTTFAAAAAWLGPAELTRGVALGDVDGDGDLDLVRGNLGAGATLTLNTGTTFDAIPVWNAPAESTWAVALGDIDDDGRIDLVRANSERGTSLYLNVGGTFAAAPAWVAPVQDNRSLALGDVDGDGDLDLVRGNLSQAATLHLNVSSPLAPGVSWLGPAADMRAAAFGDVDGDGDADLVRGNLGGGTTLHLNVNGVLQSAPAWTGPAEATLAVALVDVDGDGDLDLVRGNFDQGSTLYRNVAGTFPNTPDWTSPIANTMSLALADVDADGDPDLVLGNFDQGATLTLNQGGTFAASPAWTGPVASTRTVALGDVDGDGRVDLVRGNFDQGASLTLNTGGTFAAAPAWIGPTERTTSVALGDIDGDGRLDLVRGNLDQAASLYLNTGAAFAPLPAWTGPVEGTVSVALGDLDGDGDLDLVRGNLHVGSTVVLNTGGTFASLPAATVAAESSWCATLADVDRDGDLDALLGRGALHDHRSPWIRGAAPTRSLVNNAAHLRDVRAAEIAENTWRLSLRAVDEESDPVRIVGEYEFEGSRVWHPIDRAGGGAGAFTTSPAGVAQTLDWDVTRIAFDSRRVIVRLRADSPPRRAGDIAFVPTYVLDAGRVTPVRPSLDATPTAVSFPTVTLGDTALATFRVVNRGNRNLILQQIDPPVPEIELDAFAGQIVSPGAELVMTARFAPRALPPLLGPIHIVANDPARPSIDIAVATDVRELVFESQLLAVAPELPLGEAATVVVTPAPQVHIEDGYVVFRAHGTTAFLDSARIVTSAAQFIALVPSRAVTEAGLDWYVRVVNSDIERLDPPTAPANVFTHAVAAPTSATATATPDARGAFPAARETPVVVSLPDGAEFVSGELYFRDGGAADYLSVPLTPTELSPGIVAPVGAIPADRVGPRGVEYWALVRTLTRTLTDPATIPALAPRVLRVTVDDLAEFGTHAGRHYRLVTVPLELGLPATASLEALLSDQPEFGPPDVTRWRAYRYVPSLPGYLEVTGAANDARLHPEPGRAFWLISAAAHTVDTAPVPGRSTPTAAAYRVTLEPGWNQVGNPFVFPVHWSMVTAEGPSGAVAIEPPVAWDEARDAYSETDVDYLVPFAGYWVRNPEATPIDLVIPAIETLLPVPTSARGDVAAAATPAAPTATPAAAPAASDWRLSITATCGGGSDTRNVVGVDARASDDTDTLDRTDPPLAPGDAVSVYFADGASAAPRTVDLRAPFADADPAATHGRRWRFDVARAGGEASAEALLLILGLDALPQGLEARLVDHAMARAVDLRVAASYAFTSPRQGVRATNEPRFELIVGTPEYLDAAPSAPTGPFVTRLLPCFPNPVAGAATLRFELARAGAVHIDLFDPAGRRVRELLRGTREAGRHEWAWSARGAGVRPGVYFLRLDAGGSRDVRRVVVMP